MSHSNLIPIIPL